MLPSGTFLECLLQILVIYSACVVYSRAMKYIYALLFALFDFFRIWCSCQSYKQATRETGNTQVSDKSLLLSILCILTNQNPNEDNLEIGNFILIQSFLFGVVVVVLFCMADVVQTYWAVCKESSVH